MLVVMFFGKCESAFTLGIMVLNELHMVTCIRLFMNSMRIAEMGFLSHT